MTKHQMIIARYLTSNVDWREFAFGLMSALDEGSICKVIPAAQKGYDRVQLITDLAENFTGEKIKAIKHLREITGLGLKEAKEDVETIWTGNPPEHF